MRKRLISISLALILTFSCVGCSVTELTQKNSGTITLPESAEEIPTPEPVEPEEVTEPEKAIQPELLLPQFEGGITMFVDETTAYVNSLPMQMEAAPFVEQGIFFHPTASKEKEAAAIAAASFCHQQK